MTAGFIVLITIAIGWAVSGSVLPAFTALSVTVLFLVLKWCRLPASRIVTASFLLLVFMLQSLAFRAHYAGIIYEDLPFSYHLAMGCFLWSFLVVLTGDGSRQRAGGWYFLSGLAGSAFLYFALTEVEIFRYSPWLIRSLGSLPFILVLCEEFYRKRPVSPRALIVSIVLLAPALGWIGSASKTVSMKIHAWVSDEAEYEYQLEGEGEGGTAYQSVDLDRDEGIVDLPKRANIVLDEKIRFFLKVDTIEQFLSLTRRPLYLRTSSVSLFEGNDRILPVPVGKWILDSDDGTVDFLTRLPERSPRKTLEYSIVLPKDDTTMIPLIDGSRYIRSDGVYHIADSRYQLDQETPDGWVRFRAIGPSDERKRSIAPKKSASEDYLNLPETELSKRIAELSNELARDSPALEAIEEFITTRCRYSLRYRNPKNLSPIENLLFAERKGHCELFASATVLLLRASGIPARVAYGYTGGAANRDELAIAFRGSDIHAWAEVLDQSGHWRIFDTTPENRGSSRIARTGNHTGINWAIASSDPNGELDDMEAGRSPGSFLAVFFDALNHEKAPLYGSLGCALAAALGLVHWAAKRRTRPRGDHETRPVILTAETIASQRPDFINAILAMGENFGVPRAAGLTLKEYLSELKTHGITHDLLDQAADYYYETRYGKSEKDPAREKRLTREIRELDRTVA